MNGLIESKSMTVSSYDLWKKINEFRVSEGGKKVRHDDFLSRVIDECDDLPQCETFAVEKSNVILNKYTLNEDQALLVGMRESKIVRKKVLEWVKALTGKGQFQIPQTLGEALQLAADQAKQLELQAPKVAFVDNLVDRGTLMTSTQVAQKHKISAIKLNRYLDEIGGVYSKAVKRSRVFTQPFIENNLGEMKQTEMGHSQCLFTTKGEAWINEKLITEGLV